MLSRTLFKHVEHTTRVEWTLERNFLPSLFFLLSKVCTPLAPPNAVLFILAEASSFSKAVLWALGCSKYSLIGWMSFVLEPSISNTPLQEEYEKEWLLLWFPLDLFFFSDSKKKEEKDAHNLYSKNFHSEWACGVTILRPWLYKRS